MKLGRKIKPENSTLKRDDLSGAGHVPTISLAVAAPEKFVLALYTDHRAGVR